MEDNMNWKLRWMDYDEEVYEEYFYLDTKFHK